MPSAASVRVSESAASIRQVWPTTPKIGLILGTGLSQAADRMKVEQSLPFQRIAHFASATALSHAGRVVCGELAGIKTIAMAGRCHLYEGYSYDQVTLPVRVMRALGAEILIVSNASGGLNPGYRGGDIMVMTDHLNFMFGVHRPAGLFSRSAPPSEKCPADTRCAEDPDRPDAWMAPTNSDVRCGWCYDSELIDVSLAIARRDGFRAHRGAYVAVTGPNYETRAEYRMFRRIGGDAVGMSTVPEVLTAASLGMRVLGLSMVTNVALPDSPEKVDPQDVVEWAARAEPHLCRIVEGVAGHLMPDSGKLRLRPS